MRRLLVACLLLVIAACDEFFPPGDFEPSGSQFYANPGIEVSLIVGSLTRFSDLGKYTLDLTCRSTGSAAVADTLPAGLLLRSKLNRVQHMVVLKPHPFTAATSTTVLGVGTFCCNELRQIPDYQDTFELGPITDNSGLQQIASLVASKRITDDLMLVQNAVYQVTDRGGLTQAYIDSLDALPEESL